MTEASEGAAASAATPTLDPETAAKIASLRSQVRGSFGHVVLALMGLPRYRHQTLADLQSLVLEPLIRDRIAMARPAKDAGPLTDVTGFAIWASVDDSTDARIREQVAAKTWPIRLRPEDWQSGEINWLLDIVAPDRATATRVLAQFGQVAKGGELRLHPQVAGLVEDGALGRMRAEKKTEA